MNLTINQTTGSAATSPRTAVAAAISTALGVPAESTSVSGASKLYASLQALAKSDPAALKETLAADAKKLTDAAKTQTDSTTKKAMTDLAAKFTEASKTGDLSGLAPPAGGAAPPKGKGGGGGGGGGGTIVYQPADTNEDGTVSLQEQEAYDAKQAAKTSDSTGLGAYKQALHSAADHKAASLMATLNSIVDSVTES